jgi:hypothetical protein
LLGLFAQKEKSQRLKPQSFRNLDGTAEARALIRTQTIRKFFYLPSFSPSASILKALYGKKNGLFSTSLASYRDASFSPARKTTLNSPFLLCFILRHGSSSIAVKTNFKTLACYPRLVSRYKPHPCIKKQPLNISPHYSASYQGTGFSRAVKAKSHLCPSERVRGT